MVAVVALTAVMAVVSTAVASAILTSNPGPFTACLGVRTNKGLVYNVAPGAAPIAACNKGDTQISFSNAAGPRGDPGPAGTTGPQGPQGEPGDVAPLQSQIAAMGERLAVLEGDSVPDPVRTTVTVDRAFAIPDVDTVHVRITARDAAGRPVEGWRATVIVPEDNQEESHGFFPAGETDSHGVATADIQSPTAGTKHVLVALVWDRTVNPAEVPQVQFTDLRALRVQVYQSQVDTGHNCFVLKASDGLPTAGGASSDPPPTSDAWNASGAQPKGGYTSWIRAVAQLSESPYAWIDVTGQVTWNVLDP